MCQHLKSDIGSPLHTVFKANVTQTEKKKGNRNIDKMNCLFIFIIVSVSTFLHKLPKIQDFILNSLFLAMLHPKNANLISVIHRA